MLALCVVSVHFSVKQQPSNTITRGNLQAANTRDYMSELEMAELGDVAMANNAMREAFEKHVLDNIADYIPSFFVGDNVLNKNTNGDYWLTSVNKAWKDWRHACQYMSEECVKVCDKISDDYKFNVSDIIMGSPGMRISRFCGKSISALLPQDKT